MAQVLGRNVTFTIYNADGTSFHGLVMKKSVSDSVVMSLGDKITGDVYYGSNDLQFTMKEYITYNGINYVLVNPPTIVKEGMSSDNSELKGMTKYSLTFYHPMYMLGNFPLRDVAVSNDEKQYLSEKRKFSWIGTPDDFIAKLNKNLQGTQWIVVKSDRFPQDLDNVLSQVLTFDENTIADGLKTMYDEWGVPYIIDQIKSGETYYSQGKRFKVVVGLPSNEIYASATDEQNNNPFVFEYGKGVGLKNNSRTPRNNKIVTRLSGFGSENNIPYGYPQIRWYGDTGRSFTYGDRTGVFTNVTIGGHTFAKIVSYPIYKGILGGAYVELIKHPFTREYLMPSVYRTTLFNKISFLNSDGTPNLNYDPDIELVDYYDAVSDADHQYPNPINLQAPSFESHGFEDIKPELDPDGDYKLIAVVPLNNNLTPADKWVDDIDDDGNFLQSYFQITLPVLPFDIYACAAITEEMQINMRSGACIGCTFDVQVDWDDYKKNFYTQDGTFAPNGAQRNLTKYPNSNSGRITLILQKDNNTFGTLMPNIYQQPKGETTSGADDGDAFVILGISLPDTYITDAESRLDEEMKSYMLENNVYYFDYPLKFDEHFLATHTHILSQIKPNTVVRFEYAGQELELFVKQLTVKYGENVLPQYDITLTDNVEVTLNQIGQVADDVEKLSSLIAILRQSYGRNVWTELNKKLSKVSDDTAQGLITFVNGLIANARAQFNDNVDFGDFVQGLVGGQGARIEPNGNMEAESLYLRSELIVPKLTYNHVDVRVGDEWQTNGGGEIDYVDGFFTDTDGIEGGVIHLRLQKDDEGNIVEYGTVRLNDLCKGIFHNLNGYNDTQTSDDGKGRRTFSGFYTSYFQCISVSDDSDHYATITYKLRPTITIGGVEYWLGDDGQSTGVRGGFHPCANMTFAQYANTDQNSNRRNCQYRTTTYMRMLANMGGWDEGLANIAFQIGNTPLIASAFPSDPRASQAGRYSMWINGDIFFSGTLNRVDAWDRDIIEYPDQGDYVPATTYHLNDIVHYDGIVWRCVKNTITGEAPGSNTQDPAWVKWIYADSVEPMGRWDSAKVPYPAKAVVNLLNGVYMSKRSTSQPPLGLRTTKTGKYITKADGGYIVFDNTLQEDWELLIDIGDITNGEDGENSIAINLTNDTDSVLTDEKGNVAESLPTTTAELYDGLNKVVEGVVWSIQSTTGCTASINATTGVCQVLTMTASNAEVIIIATYKQKVYGKKFTFKKLYGKDKLWLDMPEVVYYDNPTAKNINPTSLTIKAYITSITEGEAKPINGSMGKGYVKVGSSSNRYYHGDVVNINYDSFTNGHLLINLYDSSDDIQDTEDIRLIQEPETLGSGGRWTTSTQVRKNFIYRFGNKTYIALQDSVNIPPVMSILRKKNGGAITTKNGYYIITDNNTNTEYYDVVSEDGIAVRIDLDNENDTMLYDNNGNLLSGRSISHATLYNGQTEVITATFSIVSSDGCTATVSGNTITVAAMSKDTGSVTVGCSYNGTLYKAVMTLKRLINQDKFDIVCSPNSVAYNTTTNTVQAGGTVIVEIWRTPANGGSREKVQSLDTYGLALSCTPSGIIGAYSSGSATVSVNASTASANNNIVLQLTKNGKTVDSESIPIVKAEDGTSPYFADIDEEMDSVALDADGKTTAAYDKTINLMLWHGSTAIGIDTLSYKVNGGTSYTTEQTVDNIKVTPNKTAKTIRVRVSSSKALAITNEIEIVISGTDSGSHSIHFVLNGIKQGTPAAIYRLVPSVSSVVKKKDGTYSVQNISCTCQNVTGSAIATANDGTFLYSLDGGTEQSYTSGTNIAVSTFTKSVKFVYKIGSTVVDRETILMVDDGNDAVTYELTVSPDSFNRYNNGNFKDSSVVTCNVFKIVGSTRTQLNNTTFTSEGLSFAPLINGEANSFISWSSNAFKGTIPTTANTVKIQIKKSNTVIISKDITFSFDGREGCMTRVSEWKASTSSETVTYHNDEAASSSQVSTAYIDVVALPTSSSLYPEGYIFYSCKQTHNSSNSNKPGTTGGSDFWTELSNVGPIYTSLLIAKNAFIKFGTGNQFLIIDANNKIQAGMKGSGDDGETNPIRIWAGGDNINTASDAALANVPFRVYKNGKFCATNAEISGNITATSGSLGGFTIGKTLLYNTNYNASISVKDKASNPTQVVVIGKDASDAYTGSSYKCSMQAEAIGTGTYNTALYLNAQNGTYNYAFHGNGNGVLNGFMAGFRPQIVTIPSGSGDTNSSRIFIREGSFVVIKGSHTSGHVSVGMPTLTEIRRTLGIDSSTPFFFELNVISYSTYEYVNLAFRGASGQSGSEYPVLMGYDDRPFPDGIGTRTSWQIAQGDYFKILLTYIQNTSGTLEYRAYVLQNLN